LPATFKAGDEAISDAIAAWRAFFDALAPSGRAKAASLLHVKAHVEPTAPRRSFLLSINDLVKLMNLSCLLACDADPRARLFRAFSNRMSNSI
jgi:hypothetical protein